MTLSKLPGLGNNSCRAPHHQWPQREQIQEVNRTWCCNHCQWHQQHTQQSSPLSRPIPQPYYRNLNFNHLHHVIITDIIMVTTLTSVTHMSSCTMIPETVTVLGGVPQSYDSNYLDLANLAYVYFAKISPDNNDESTEGC